MPTGSEIGWKYAIQAMLGFVTVIRIRWAPQDAPSLVKAATSTASTQQSVQDTFGTATSPTTKTTK
jgi:hypothetical protein